MALEKNTTVESKAQTDNSDDQLPSKLLLLPRELRDKIWTALLSSTRLSYGFSYFSKVSMKPAPNSLSILRVCKTINNETKDLWLKHVLFNFENAEALLYKLSALPLDTLSQIRHVRLCKLILMLFVPEDVCDQYYTPAAVFKLLPGLCLDKLTVLGSSITPDLGYVSLQNLVKKGDGWKELHFITPDATMLGFARLRSSSYPPEDDEVHVRKPQPADWIGNLVQRDTAETGASITIYRSTVPDAPCSVLNPSTREVINQTVTAPQSLETFGIEEDETLMSERKELLVVVKRGRGANLSDTTGLPYGLDDIREWADGLSWAELHRISYPWLDEDDSDDDDETIRRFEYDTYDDVEEMTKWYERISSD